PKPEPKVFSLPGASVSGLDSVFQDPESSPASQPQTTAEPFPQAALQPQPQAAAEPFPQAEAVAPEEELESASASEDTLGEIEPTVTVAEPAAPEINEEAATPQPVEQDVAALDNAPADRLPLEDEPPAAETIPEPIVSDAQTADEQLEAESSDVEPPQENAE